MSRKILITGCSGFLGLHLTGILAKEKEFSLAGITEIVDFDSPFLDVYHIDIRDRQKMIEIFGQTQPDYVFHLAAQASVSVSVKDPELDHSINIIGSNNVIEASVKAKAKKIIYSGSGGSAYGDYYLDKGYENLPVEEMQKVAPDEKTPFKPISPYARNKADVISILKDQHDIKWTALMYTNVYGPRQDPFGEAGVMAIFCQKMLSGQEPTIFGDGKCIRDYVYVGDVARANILAIEKADNEIVNIGTGLGKDVNQIYAIIKDLTGFQGKPVFAPFRDGDVLVSIVNNKKAKNALGWSPKTKLPDGIKETVAFFENFRA